MKHGDPLPQLAQGSVVLHGDGAAGGQDQDTFCVFGHFASFRGIISVGRVLRNSNTSNECNLSFRYHLYSLEFFLTFL